MPSALQLGLATARATFRQVRVLDQLPGASLCFGWLVGSNARIA